MGAERYHEVEISGTFEPLTLATALVDDNLFSEYVVYEAHGRWTVAGDALGGVRVDRTHVRTRWAGSESVSGWDGDPLDAARKALERLPVGSWQAFGWAAFELAYVGHEPLPPEGEDLLNLIVPRTIISIGPTDLVIRTVDEHVQQQVISKLTSKRMSPPKVQIPIDVRQEGRAEYERIVAEAVTDIASGKLTKVILSRCVAIPFSVDLVATYLAGRRANTPARSFLLQLGGWRALGFSPEIVVAVEDGNVVTEPLAGTRACGHGERVDAQLGAALLADPKEVFEHAISVKLSQEEMQSCCDCSTVAVEEFMSIKRRGSAQHLASRVRGRLAPDESAWSALRKLFPAVTASGIPKRAAYAAISRLEGEPRGLYAGAVLAVDSRGKLDAALVLRALYERNGQVWLRAGAGIVAGSLPSREFEETCEKLTSVASHVVPAKHVLIEVPTEPPSVLAQIRETAG